jgi:protein-L-isoaspartate(D-aspartate) O-methyltransferase
MLRPTLRSDASNARAMNHSDDLRIAPKPEAIQRSAEEYADACLTMVETQLRRRGIKDSAVLEAMTRTPRHEFVPQEFRDRAYDDIPLPIGEGQTISQPYMVAAITAALHLTGTERILEVGAGCGYQAAILAALAKEIFAVEFRADLAAAAGRNLICLGYKNVHVHCGDGTLGLPDLAPFDCIVISAGAPAPPAPLLDQLADPGRMVVPVGDVENQNLHLIEREHGNFRKIILDSCRFVPLVGAHGWKGLSFP